MTVETNTKIEAQRQLTYQHSSGEIFIAESVEVARGMCPVLGRMSLEEVGLLLELESMGKEILSDQKVLHSETIVDLGDTSTDDMHKKIKDVRPESMKYINPEEEIEVARLINEMKISDSDNPEAFEVRDDFRKPQEPLTIKDAESGESYSSIKSDSMKVGISTEPPRTFLPKINSSDLKEKELIQNEEPKIVTLDNVNSFIVNNDYQLSESNNLTEGFPEEFVNKPEKKILPTFIKEGTIKNISEFKEEELEDNFNEENSSANKVELINMVSQFIPESPAIELPSPLEEVEMTIGQLINIIENEDIDIPESANQIFEDIIFYADSFKEFNEGQVVEFKSEFEFDQGLMELYKELFDVFSIDYSDDLINSIVILSNINIFNDYQPEKPLKSINKYSEISDIGTREFLQKLLHGIRDFKQRAANVCLIGRSVLRALSKVSYV